MGINTLSIDGLAPAASRKKDEVVLFDRERHPVQTNRATPSINSLQPVTGSAQIDSKLRATMAKQRGWEVVAQARQDAKHRPRHNQRHAAKTAAHHHRQRHDIDNYARVHTATLELDESMKAITHSQPKVSLGLHISNLLQSHSIKFVGFGMFVLAIVGGAALFTGQATPQTATQPVGQVQAINTTSTSQIESTQTVEQTNPPAQSSQVAKPDSDANLGLWSSKTTE